MLTIQTTRKNKRSIGSALGMIVASILMIGGVYVVSLVVAPAVAPLIAMKPITVQSLPAPKQTENRIVIPKIGVNIPYGTDGDNPLDRGALWRYPDRGNPSKGGNFIIAAHRFSIEPTPGATIEKSPFFNIDKLAVGDKIVVDYSGTRYGYEISHMTDVRPDQTEIEAPSEDAKLTLYSCELGGAEAGRIVITAEPLGEVAVNN